MIEVSVETVNRLQSLAKQIICLAKLRNGETAYCHEVDEFHNQTGSQTDSCWCGACVLYANLKELPNNE